MAFLGPPGSFGEEALRTQPDLLALELVSLPSMTEILAAVEAGGVDLGFVAIENSIEGTVNTVIDALVFDRHLLVQREVEFEVTQNLLAPAGTALADIRRVVSFPNALGQCRLNEGRDLAIKNGLRIGANDAGAQVLHHLIGLQHVRSDLMAPADLGF